MTESSTPEISGESVTQANSTTTLVFTRPLSPSDSTKQELSAEEEDEAIFIWGYGFDNDLAQHAGRGAVTLTDLFCTGGVADDELDDDLDAETEVETCESSDPEFEFEVELDAELALFWSVVEGGTAVSVKVRAKKKR